MRSMDFVLCGQFISHDPWGGGEGVPFNKNQEPHAFVTYSKNPYDKNTSDNIYM